MGNARATRESSHPERTVWLTAGPGREPIDAVRSITNHSTGALGKVLAEAFAQAGWSVTAWVAEGATCIPSDTRVAVRRFTSGDSLLASLQEALSSGSEGDQETDAQSGHSLPDLILHAAALGDFQVRQIKRLHGEPINPRGKVESRCDGLLLELEPAPKVLPRLPRLFPMARVVGWKFEVDGDRADLIRKGLEQIAGCATDACVLNGPAWGEGFGVLSPDGQCEVLSDRPALAAFLIARYGAGGSGPRRVQ